MEIFLILVFIWFFFRMRGKKAEKTFRKAEQQAMASIASEQAEYDEYLFGLPELIGDGSYSQATSGTERFAETLDLYAKWLVSSKPKQREIRVILDRDPEQTGHNAIKLESGKATLSLLPKSVTPEFEKLIKTHGPVLATARFVVDPFGKNHEIWLDASRPLSVKPRP